jgi:hypothetical protein
VSLRKKAHLARIETDTIDAVGKHVGSSYNEAPSAPSGYQKFNGLCIEAWKLLNTFMRFRCASQTFIRGADMGRILRNLAAMLAATTVSTGAIAAVASWTDWLSAGTNSAAGTLDVSGTSVGISYSGPYAFVQTSGGLNYWSPSTPYTSSTVENAPPGTDIVALGIGGAKTVTFSQAVQDPLIALVSWNGNTVDFGVPIEIISFGQGFWGNGTPILNAAGTGFFGSGEVHGVIRLPGSYTSITFTDTTEGWHGFTIGVLGLGNGGGGNGGGTVPEPASLALVGVGLIGIGLARRRRSVR